MVGWGLGEGGLEGWGEGVLMVAKGCFVGCSPKFLLNFLKGLCFWAEGKLVLQFL